MKKKILIMITAIAVMGGVLNVYLNTKSCDDVSQLVLLNLEALASNENPGGGENPGYSCTASRSCGSSPYDYVSCTGLKSCERISVRKNFLVEKFGVRCDNKETFC